jgi:putative glutamine amidotransferase
MSIKIAIPEPTSSDPAYNGRSLPPYIAALQSSGATPVLVPLHERQDRVARLLAGVQGVLLPGSRFDVDPERYGEARIPECGPADPDRAAVDELLLQDAFNLRKPVLAICHGVQTLNVWLNGTLVQDLDSVLKTKVNHAPGRDVIDAHSVRIEENSVLGSLTDQTQVLFAEDVNSSHHQALARIGDRLKVSAVSADDGVVEAVELESTDHFVVGVQWHPERTFAVKPFSRAIFRAFVEAAARWRPAAETVSEAAE